MSRVITITLWGMVYMLFNTPSGKREVERNESDSESKESR